jgi:cell division protein FtsN
MVRREPVPLRVSCAFGAIVCAMCFLGGCAVRDMGGAVPPARGEVQAAQRTEPEAKRDTVMGQQAPYNLEEEMPEKTAQRPVELVEKLEPIRPDSFNVQDIDAGQTPQEAAPKQLYDIGYRIQVFASSDKAAAEKVKQEVGAASGMPVYVDYEEGLYKVRAGDFLERKEAAEARQRLVGTYPGSWIVRTTIRKAS